MRVTKCRLCGKKLELEWGDHGNTHRECYWAQFTKDALKNIREFEIKKEKDENK